RKKGIVRVGLGLLMDLSQLKPKYVLHRVRAMLKFKNDSFDVYSRLIRMLKQHKISMKFLCQVRDFSTYDCNINHNRLHLHSLRKTVADYAEVGLQPGY